MIRKSNILKIKIQQKVKKMNNIAFLTDNSGSKKLQLSTKIQDKFSIGRIHTNSLQILDGTVSKNHALIYYLSNQNKYVLQDLGSINGTFINGKQIIGSKTYLKNEDILQFGKNQQKYIFKYVNPKPQKTGKINFKDYNFELQDQLVPKPLLQKPKPTSEKINQTYTSNFNKPTNNNIEQFKNTQQSFSKPSKNKFQRAIKIPKFQQFLEIQTDINDDDHSGFKRSNNQQSQIDQQPKKWDKNKNSQLKKGGVKLPQLNNNQLSEQDKINKMMLQRKRQLQKAQKQALLKKTQQQQRLLQQRLRLQIQKAQQQQKLLRQKYETEKKSQQQQKKLLQQKLLLQQRIRLQQKQLKQKQQLLNIQLRQKQQNLMNQLIKQKQSEMLLLKQKQKQIISRVEQQKKRQLGQIKLKQAKIREQSEEVLKRDVQNRKRQLELEAEALTRQYQNIYKETIKKIKLNIENEQQKVNQIEKQIEKQQKQIKDLSSCLTAQQQEMTQIKTNFLQINGRNKAFLLYSSHLQSKIDNLKLQGQKQNMKDPSKTSLEINDSLIHSRKLLNMKLNEQKELERQTKQFFVSLNVTSPQSEEYLATILENYQEIQRLKQIYFLCIEDEKVIQNKWDLELEQNNVLEEKVRNIKKQTQGNKKKLVQNLNDNLKKLTEQRLHMLKMMYYVPEDKKNAAKFLVEEMVNIEQQNKAITIDNENVHSKITSLIIQIQQKKRQNQHLSNLLFGADSTSHHFDNMKQQINRLISAIQNQKDQYRITNMIKISQELCDLQNKIYLQSRKQKKIKQEIKNNGYVVPALLTEKNPLVFFGKMLTKKDVELQSAEEQQKILEKNLIEARARVTALNDKKLKLNRLLEQYKQRQLKNVRDLLK